MARALLSAVLCDHELVTKPAWVTVSLSDGEMVELANFEDPFSYHLPSILEMKCHQVGNQRASVGRPACLTVTLAFTVVSVGWTLCPPCLSCPLVLSVEGILKVL